MGRRRQKDNAVFFEIALAVIRGAWAARPLYGALAGIGIAAVFCGVLPALLSLGIPTSAPVTNAELPAAMAGTILGLISKMSFWFGAGMAAVCFLCALVNVFRKPESGNHLSLVSTEKPAENKASSAPDIPFIRKDLMTASELAFFKRLRAAFPDVQVCPQVALAAIVDIPAKYNNNRFKHVNRAPFAAKYADFAIVDLDTGAVYAIIELDDHTHDSSERKQEDAERDAMLEEVGIPVHRFDARKMPSVKEIQDWFDEN